MQTEFVHKQIEGEKQHSRELSKYLKRLEEGNSQSVSLHPSIDVTCHNRSI